MPLLRCGLCDFIVDIGIDISSNVTETYRAWYIYRTDSNR